MSSVLEDRSRTPARLTAPPVPARVVIVVPGLWEGGGVPAVARFVHRALSETGRYEVSFVTLPLSSRDPLGVQLTSPRSWRRGVREKKGEWLGAPVHEVGAWGTELEFMRFAPRPALTRVLRDADLVFVVAGLPSWALVALRTETPIALQVATLVEVERKSQRHAGPLPHRLWRGAMTAVTRAADRLALRVVDRALVENAWMLEALSEQMPPGHVRFAPPGVDTEVFRPGPGGFRDSPYLLSIGRLHDPRKNVPMLFEAYRQVLDARPDAPPLVLAGMTGPSPEAWAVAERLGIRDHVRMHDEVSEEELVALYQGATAFLLSSDEEGLGLVLVEAMACAVPVVSTACGGPEACVVHGETGFLTPVGDAEALAHRTLELLADVDRQRAMGRAARAHVETHFSYAATAQHYVAVCDELLGVAASGAE